MNIKLFFTFFVLFTSSCSNHIKIEPSGDRSTTDFFVSTTDDAAKASGLKLLRDVQLDDDITEIRIWVGFGPTVLQDLFRFYKSDDGSISGIYIWYYEVDFDSWEKQEVDEFYSETYEHCTKIGKYNDTESCEVNYYQNTDRQKVFADLEKLDIWNIPDESEVPKLQHKDIITTLDGSHIVVELKKKGFYRSFSHRLSPAPKIKKYRYGHKIMDVLY